MSQWKAHDTDPGQTFAPGHYSEIFSPSKFRRLVKETDTALQAINARMPFDAIATCGLSGNLLGAALAHEMGIPLIVIRKAVENESSHHGYAVTGISKGRVLIIDDLIDSGSTIVHMLNRLKHAERSWIKRELEPVGILLTTERFRRGMPAPMPDAKAEREAWGTRIGKKDDTGCRPLPVFFLRDVIHDDYWPELCPKLEPVAKPQPEELPRSW